MNYYYMRLKDNFFDDDAIKLLEAMPDGYLYENILLKMYLKSLKNKGMLVFSDYIPYNSMMLSTITGHPEGVVEKALDVFQRMNLIEILDNGTIFMMEIQNYIGKASSEADRKREYRQLIEETKKESNKERNNNNSNNKDIIVIDNMSEICPTNVRTNVPKTTKKEKNIKNIIPPTVDMVSNYCKERGNGIDADSFVDYYTTNGWMVGKSKMKDWQAAVRTWERNKGFKKNEVTNNVVEDDEGDWQ